MELQDGRIAGWLVVVGAGISLGAAAPAPPAAPAGPWAPARRFLYGAEPLRTKPAADAPVVVALGAGAEIALGATTGAPVDTEGVAAPWVEAKAGGKVGYLRSGMVAAEAHVGDLDGDGREEMLLVRNRTWSIYDDPRPKHASKLSLRVVRDGAVLAESEIAGAGTAGEEAWLLNPIAIRKPEGLTPPATFVSIPVSFVGATSGSGEALFVFAKGAIRNVLRMNYDETGKGWCQRLPIWPADKGGKPNIVALDVACYDAPVGPEGPGKFTSGSIEGWSWDGTAFVARASEARKVVKAKPAKKAK